MTVTVTSRRLPDPAAPGFFLTIACRSHKVFVTYRLKITPYLADERQSWEGKRTQRGRALPGVGQACLAGRRCLE